MNFLTIAKDIVAFFFTRIFLLNFFNRWSLKIADELSTMTIDILHEGEKYTFCANDLKMTNRAKGMLTREPETIRWINEFDKEDILYDIGANIGAYTIYAANKCKQIYSFEPVSLNYSFLNRNIYLNNKTSNVLAYCIAISNEHKFETMRLRSFVPASSGHSFAENLDENHDQFNPVAIQGAVSFSLDQLVYEYDFPIPDHIKIDVDGLEGKILSGASRLLKEQKIRSVLIELNHEIDISNNVLSDMEKYGLKLVEKAPGDYSTGFKHIVGNFIFKRV